MKVIIATEFLHEKDWGIIHLEEMISLFPQASLVSLTYKPMSLGSKIESRTIVSSKIPAKKLLNKPWQIYPLVSNIPIPEDTQLVISISRGYIHHLNIPSGCAHFVYHIQPVISVTGWKRFLDSALSAKKKVERSPLVKEVYLSSFLVNTQSSAQGDEQILKPFFKPGIHEFDQLTDKEKEIDCILHISTQSRFNLLDLGSELIEQGVKFLFHADEDVLDRFVTDSFLRTEHCYEKGCHGSEQKLFENTKMFVDLTNDVFNPLVLQALSAGVGVYVSSQVYNGIFSPELAMYFLKKPNVKEALECSWWNTFDNKRSRREALRLNGRVFKRNAMKYIQELLDYSSS